MQPDLDIAIVGAGAAGLMAAIFAGREAKGSLKIAALDGAPKLGAKILVAGGGRCNVTHDVVTPADFNGATSKQIEKVLRTFDVDPTVAFFRELGVELKREETGKLFPTTDRAQSVLDALLRTTTDAGVQILTNHRIQSITAEQARPFALTTADRTLTARTIILATGGKSLPKTGSDGHGYELAKSLGHTLTPTTPGLVPLVLEPNYWLTHLSGITLSAELSLVLPTGKVLHRQRGSTLLTHFGLSGPAVLDISRHWIASHNAGDGAQLVINVMPGGDGATLDRLLVEWTAHCRKGSIVHLLTELKLPERLVLSILHHAAMLNPGTTLPHLSREQRRDLVDAMTALPLPVVRDRGYLFAEVTAGGVPLEEVNLSTMASRRCQTPGLYLCGEILNVDGRIGGYNFQWAWCTGRLAGMHAAKLL